MTITYIRGDLLSVTSGHIVHGCNAQGVMGSGVALAIATKWPEVYEKYKLEHATRRMYLGSAHSVEISDRPHLLVWNAITQEYFGRTNKRYVSYDAIESSLSKINTSVIELKDVIQPVINIPKIGAGLGGGNWSIIEKIITETVTVPINVWVP